MDIGVVGLGDIAGKAYLPLLSTRPDVRLHLASRDLAHARQLGAQFHATSVSGDLDGLLGRRLDAVFVTAATAAHPPLVAAVLDAGVAVHVDKPLADTASAASELVERSRARGTLLAVGFNRRFAPAYREVAAQGPMPFVSLGKHRAGLDDVVRRVVFDDFIHVVDTLRWLLGAEPTRVEVTGRLVEGRLHHLLLLLAADDRHAVGVMNRRSGTTREVLEIQRDRGTTLVEDLSVVRDHRDGAVTRTRAGDWQPMLRVRGFEDMVSAFLHDVAEGLHSDGGAQDALLTHALCETIVTRLEALGGLTDA